MREIDGMVTTFNSAAISGVGGNSEAARLFAGQLSTSLGAINTARAASVVVTPRGPSGHSR